MAHRDGAYPGFSSMKQLEVFLLPPGWNASPSQGHLQRSHRWYPFIQLGGVSHCNGKVSCPRIQTMDGTKDPYEFLSFARAFIEKGSQRRISFISRLKRAIHNNSFFTYHLWSVLENKWSLFCITCGSVYKLSKTWFDLYFFSDSIGSY